ncbi:hypothetical protein EGW08_021776 [Elysia chlorotica]|uniref:Uncharacterized protein n=1 Tax=Elysia chlorotica TaxID=188477 RepID=A0A433SMT3_ELYCH|nr:hypothetical protein EGW08_021776 [Elysia chlorotica]
MVYPHIHLSDSSLGAHPQYNQSFCVYLQVIRQCQELNIPTQERQKILVIRQCRELSIPTQERQKVLVEDEEPVTVFLMLDTFELRRLILRHPETKTVLPNEVAKYRAIFLKYSDFIAGVRADPSVLSWCSNPSQRDYLQLRRLILRHPETKTVLPNEVAKYRAIFLKYSDFIAGVRADPSVLSWCSNPSQRDYLQETSDEVVQIYRILKRNIDSRSTQEPVNRDFGTWVVM